MARGPKHLTSEQRTIAARYAAGESMNQIRLSTGHARTYVIRALRMCGVPLRPEQHNEIPEAECQELIHAYVVGRETLKQIAKRTGRSTGALKRNFERRGVDLKFIGGLNKSRGLRKHSLDEHYFDEIDTERKAWLLGFIASDGSVSRSTRGCRYVGRLGIGLAWKDREILDTIKDDLKFTGSVRRVVTKYKGEDYLMAMLQINSVLLMQGLAKQGIVPNKSLTIRMWDGPSDLMRHFIRGLADGDGSWAKCRFSPVGRQFCLVGNKGMCKDFVAYCERTLGVKPYCYQKSNSKAWQAITSDDYAVTKLAHHLYHDATIALSRKWEIAKTLSDIYIQWRRRHYLPEPATQYHSPPQPDPHHQPRQLTLF